MKSAPALAHPLALWQGLSFREGEERFFRLKEILSALSARCLVLDETDKPGAFSQGLHTAAARVGAMAVDQSHWHVVELAEKLAKPVRLIS